MIENVPSFRFRNSRGYIGDTPLYIKERGRYKSYGKYQNRLMRNEKVVLVEIHNKIGNPANVPPTFKQPVSNARLWLCDGGIIGIIADQDHHFHPFEIAEDDREFVRCKASTLKQFFDFRRYSVHRSALLVLAIPTLDRILQTSLKQLLFYFYGLGIGYVNGTPESVLLCGASESESESVAHCTMAFADFEASFIISPQDLPIVKGDCAFVDNRLPGHEWIARAVCYSLVSNCPVPEASPEAGQPNQPYDPIAVTLFHEGQKWYEILRVTRYSRLREPLHYSEYQGFTASAAYEDEYFPVEHTVERLFYRYLMGTSTWRTCTELDLKAFSKMAATLVYLLHEDPAKRLFAIGIWCGNSPPASTWTLNRVDLHRWIHQPWEEPLNVPETFFLELGKLLETINDLDACNSWDWNPSWLHHHYGDANLGEDPNEQHMARLRLLRKQRIAMLFHLDSEEGLLETEETLLETLLKEEKSDSPAQST